MRRRRRARVYIKILLAARACVRCHRHDLIPVTGRRSKSLVMGNAVHARYGVTRCGGRNFGFPANT